jgi:hypothetical protein
MIHLGAYLYDDEEQGAAKLNTIFIVPHKDGTDDECHPKGEEHTLGSETTGEGERIDIRTTTHFWKEAGLDGEIDFYKRASELDICCKPGNNKFITGKMIMMDIDQEICPDSGSGDSATEESVGSDGEIVTGEPDDPTVTRTRQTPPPGGSISPGGLTPTGDPVTPPGGTTQIGHTSDRCKWVPAIQIDECELVGNHFVKLINNDAAVASAANTYCNTITNWTTSLAAVANANIGTIAAKMTCLDAKIQALCACVNQITECLQNSMYKQSNLQAAQINAAFAAIAAQLAECDCPVQPPKISGWSVDHCPECECTSCAPFLFSASPTLSCDICTGIDLEGPCTNSENFTVGAPCGGGTPPTITTQFGECQTHDPA